MSSIPSTPVSRYPLQRTYRPLNSSPLVSPTRSHSSPLSSSVNSKSVPGWRRSQFKSQTPTSSIVRSSTLPSSSSSRHSTSSRTRSASTSGSTARQTVRSSFVHAEDHQKQFLRERIRAKCLQRAQQARARAVKQRRYTGHSDRSSDGFDEDGRMDDDEEEDEDDDTVMDDELFRRIMAQTNRKTNHSYRISYALEVGSSFDPDLEDVAEWEDHVKGPSTPYAQPLDFSPADIDDEELEAYAEECAWQADLDDFADIPEEELFHLSDIDDVLDDNPKATDDMDLS